MHFRKKKIHFSKAQDQSTGSHGSPGGAIHSLTLVCRTNQYFPKYQISQHKEVSIYINLQGQVIISLQKNCHTRKMQSQIVQLHYFYILLLWFAFARCHLLLLLLLLLFLRLLLLKLLLTLAPLSQALMYTHLQTHRHIYTYRHVPNTFLNYTFWHLTLISSQVGVQKACSFSSSFISTMCPQVTHFTFV